MRNCWFTYKGVDWIAEYSGEINAFTIEGLYAADTSDAQDIWDLVRDEVQDKALEEVDIAIRQEGIE